MEGRIGVEMGVEVGVWVGKGLVVEVGLSWYLRVAVGKGVYGEWERTELKVWYMKDMSICLCTFFFASVVQV